MKCFISACMHKKANNYTSGLDKQITDEIGILTLIFSPFLIACLFLSSTGHGCCGLALRR